MAQGCSSVYIKGVWVGRSETLDEHVVLTPGGRVLSRTNRKLEPTHRHDARFLSTVKGLPWDAQDGIVRGRPRKEPTQLHPVLVGESTQTHSAGSCSESGKETDDSHDVPMNESPSSDGQPQSSGGSHDRSNSKAKSATDDADGVRQRLKFDGKASGMTPDPKRMQGDFILDGGWSWRRLGNHGGRTGRRLLVGGAWPGRTV